MSGSGNQIYGAITVKLPSGVWVDLYDNEMDKFDGDAGAYGANWKFLGDQTFQESSICIVHPYGETKSFYGRKAFNEFLDYNSDK